jgi:rubredoxin
MKTRPAGRRWRGFSFDCRTVSFLSGGWHAARYNRYRALLTGKSRHVTQMEVVEMQKNEKDYTCALCGYTASGKFVGDICPNCGLTYWKCGKCGFTFTAATLPEACPSCGEKCDFLNVTCYTPECGGPGHIDPRLLQKQ